MSDKKPLGKMSSDTSVRYSRSMSSSSFGGSGLGADDGWDGRRMGGLRGDPSHLIKYLNI